MSNFSTDMTGLQFEINRTIQDHWEMFLFEGVVLMLLGIVAITLPFITGLALTTFLGILLIMAGGASLLSSIKAWRSPGPVVSVLSAVLAIGVGSVFVWSPIVSLLSLSMVLIAYFITDGCFNIVLAFQHRKDLAGRWEWVLINGILDLLFAVIMLSSFPSNSLLAIGILVGVDMVAGGSTLIWVALGARMTDKKKLPA